MPPPQFFELNRLNNFPRIDTIAKFAKERNGKDVPFILPIHYVLKDSVALVYPGDDLYPKDPNPYETTHDAHMYKEKNYDELREGCKNLFRKENLFFSNNV